MKTFIEINLWEERFLDGFCSPYLGTGWERNSERDIDSQYVSHLSLGDTKMANQESEWYIINLK